VHFDLSGDPRSHVAKRIDRNGLFIGKRQSTRLCHAAILIHASAAKTRVLVAVAT
jgi:hypothetical protein